MERFIVTYLEANNRLDKALSLFKSDISRSYIAKLIEEGKVLVNDKQEKSSYKVKENDVISLLDFEDKKADIKEEDIHAEFKNGILKVEVPKKEEIENNETIKRIEIK